MSPLWELHFITFPPRSVLNEVTVMNDAEEHRPYWYYERDIFKLPNNLPSYTTKGKLCDVMRLRNLSFQNFHHCNSNLEPNYVRNKILNMVAFMYYWKDWNVNYNYSHSLILWVVLIINSILFIFQNFSALAMIAQP